MSSSPILVTTSVYSRLLSAISCSRRASLTLLQAPDCATCSCARTPPEEQRAQHGTAQHSTAQAGGHSSSAPGQCSPHNPGGSAGSRSRAGRMALHHHSFAPCCGWRPAQGCSGCIAGPEQQWRQQQQQQQQQKQVKSQVRVVCRSASMPQTLVETSRFKGVAGAIPVSCAKHMLRPQQLDRWTTTLCVCVCHASPSR